MDPMVNRENLIPRIGWGPYSRELSPRKFPVQQYITTAAWLCSVHAPMPLVYKQNSIRLDENGKAIESYFCKTHVFPVPCILFS
jgi:hypothetical protein